MLTGSEYDEEGGHDALSRPSFTVLESPDSRPSETGGRATSATCCAGSWSGRSSSSRRPGRRVAPRRVDRRGRRALTERDHLQQPPQRIYAAGEVLAEHDRQRLVFEPLRSDAVGVSRNIPRCLDVDPASDDPEVDRVFKKLLSGRIRNLWVDKQNTSRLPRGRVIKDCDGTNLAPYLATHFPRCR